MGIADRPSTQAYASYLVSNDIEDDAAVAGRCYLRNRSPVDLAAICQFVADLNARVETEPLPPGFIEEMYAPRDEACIAKEDRVFYTRNNARRLDNYRRLIDPVRCDMKDTLLGPLISEASIHANTAGVFKGFYKNRHTRVGQFGGSGRDALVRYERPTQVSPLSGIPTDWRRSGYNVRTKSLPPVEGAPEHPRHAFPPRFFNNRSIHVTEQLFLVERH